MKNHRSDILLVVLLVCSLAFLFYAHGALQYQCNALAAEVQGEGAMICITAAKNRELRQRDKEKMAEFEARLKAVTMERNQTPSNGPAILLRSPAALP